MADRIKKEKGSFWSRLWIDGKMDLTFLFLLLIILTIGLVMLFSASYVYAETHYGNSYHFITKQATFAVVGVFSVLALKGVIQPDNVMIIVSMVVSFYFGTQHEKSGAVGE